jgi:hypothetical protein
MDQSRLQPFVTRPLRASRAHVTTLLSILLLVLVYLIVPQIRHVFDLPGLRSGNGELALRVGFYLLVLVMMAFYVALAFAVTAGRRASVAEGRPSVLRWLSVLADRISRPLIAVPSRLENLRNQHSGRSGLAVGGIFVLFAAVLLFLPLLLAVDIYPLNDDGARLLLSSLVALIGLWIALPVPGAGAGDQALYGYARLRTVGARAIFFLLVTNLIGEVLWHLPALLPDVFTYRNYTLWALLHIGFLVVLWGRISDSASDRFAGKAAMAVALLLVIWVWQSTSFRITTSAGVGAAFPGPLRPSAVDTSDQQKRAVSVRWLKDFERRLNSLPPEHPAIFLALSGGGSRAALFSALALDTLRRTSLEGGGVSRGRSGGTLYDRVVLISSVSGGSVASAHFAVHADSPEPGEYHPKNSFPAEIAELTHEAAIEFRTVAEERLSGATQRAGGGTTSPGDELSSPIKRWDLAIADHILPLLEQEGGLGWPLSSPLIDAMTTDFMAPLLRGLLLPGVERGDSVRAFWRRRLNWRPGPKGAPLLVFNATEVSSGRRLAIGVPPLPPTLFEEDARELSRLHSGYVFDLATAVRLSANFPWGFSVPRVQDYSTTGVPDVLLIDGGVVDNTGIDTIDFVVSGLDRLAHHSVESVGPEVRALADLCLEALKSRGVLVIEVDAGAKPFAPGYLATTLPGVFAPFTALKRASFSQASFARESHLKHIRETMTAPHPRAPARTPAAEAGLALFGYATFLCNEDRNVMTAWALGPEDKGAVIARFFYERDVTLQEIRDRLEEIREDQTLLRRTVATPKTTAAAAAFLSNTLQDRQEAGRAGLLVSLESAERQREFEQKAPEAAMRPVTAVRGSEEGEELWVFLGTYEDTTEAWETRYFSLANDRPEELPGTKAAAIGHSNVRRNLPSATGTFAPIVRSLPPGTVVDILSVEPWDETGFMWARVTVDAEAGLSMRRRR